MGDRFLDDGLSVSHVLSTVHRGLSVIRQTVSHFGLREGGQSGQVPRAQQEQDNQSHHAQLGRANRRWDALLDEA